MATPIKFGTSGWRAILADEFTFDNVRLVCAAIGDLLAAEGGSGRGLAIGYDTRFLSERFAAEGAKVLAAGGIRCAVSTTAIPTPAVSHAVRHGGFAGAVNLTASHNPADYNGLKFSNDRGAPAPPDTTKRLEAAIARRQAGDGAPPPASASRAPASVEAADFSAAYFAQVESLVNLGAIREAGLRLAVDLRWGAARGWLDRLLATHRIPHTLIHDARDVNYGGVGPDVSARALAELSEAVTGTGASIGVACDGDADRFGVVDSDGTWINPNLLLALLADYLAESRGWRSGLGRTYATTGLIDAVAAHHGVPVHQTPVGFKYLGEMILDGRVFLAGEESAGMSIQGHLPEKDGILAVLLAAEMVASRGKSLAAQRDALFAKVGPLHSARDDFRVTAEQTARLQERMKAPPERIGERTVERVTVLDGIRLDFAGGAWLLMRPSGTEPVVRYYVEAPTLEELGDLKRAGRAALTGDGA